MSNEQLHEVQRQNCDNIKAGRVHITEEHNNRLNDGELINDSIIDLLDSSEFGFSGYKISSGVPRLKSSVSSLTQLERADFVQKHVASPSNQTRSEPPWTAWLRPSSWLTKQTHGWIEKRNLLSFYNDSSKDTFQQMTPHLHKQQ
jgi:hypothetical protein